MNKYDPLWNWIQNSGMDAFRLTFAEIRAITGFAIDHSFLTCKKELAAFGYRVGKISMQEQTIAFEKLR